MAAANQAMKDSALEIEPSRLGVYVGSGIGGMDAFVAESKKLLESNDMFKTSKAYKSYCKCIGQNVDLNAFYNWIKIITRVKRKWIVLFKVYGSEYG